MRVFVPEEQLRTIATRDHVPVEISQLEKQLKNLVDARREQVTDRPYLAQAFYVARLERGGMTSDLSRWRIDGRGKNIAFPAISLALRRARVDSNQKQLLDACKTLPNGSLQVELDDESASHWFGFSASSEVNGLESYEFNLPIAAEGGMLITTQPNIELMSEDVVVEAISNPTELLPEDWPASASLSLLSTTGRQWWHIPLSAVSSFTLVARELTTARQNLYRHASTEARLDYLVRENAVDMAARFVVLPLSADRSISLRISNDVRIQNLLVDGIPTSWRSRPSLSADSTLIELDLKALDGKSNEAPVEAAVVSPPTATGQPASMPTNAALRESAANGPNRPSEPDDLQSKILIELQAVQLEDATHEQEQLALPSLTIAECFHQSGFTRVFSTNGLVIDSLQAANCRVDNYPSRSPLLDGQLLSTLDLSELNWRVTWSGDTPNILISRSHQEFPWIANGLTRFVINPDWLTANCRLRIENESIRSNSLKIKVQPEWFVDRVKLIGDRALDTQVELVESSAEDEGESEIVISWLDQRRSSVLELEVAAHRPLGKETEDISRVLSMASSQQIDHFVMQSAGRYRVQLTPAMMRYQRSNYELPDWQQELLNGAESEWIFESDQRINPQIRLITGQGLVTGELVAWLLPQFHQSKLEIFTSYLLNIKPVAGPVGNVRLRLPKTVNPSACKWTLATPLGPEPFTPRVVETSDEDTVVEVTGQGQSDSLVIGCVVPATSELAVTQGLDVPMLTLEDANVWQITLVAPEELFFAPANANGTLSMELLPASYLENAGTLKLASQVGIDPPTMDRFVAARLEAESISSVGLQGLAEAKLLQGWIESAQIDHYIDGETTRSHRTRWRIASVAQDSIQFRIPEDWSLVLCRIDGAWISASRLSDGVLELPIAAGRVSDVELDFTSQTPRGIWLQKEKISAPLTDLPVLQTQRYLHVPPSRAVVNRSIEQSVDGPAWNRLRPSYWWQSLAPSGFQVDGRSAENQDWSRVELGRQTASQPISQTAFEEELVWTISRTSLSGLMLGFCMFVTSLALMLFVRSDMYGWLALVSALMLLLLVPTSMICWTQLVVLSVSLAAILRILQLCRQQRMPVDTSQRRSLSALTSSRATTAGLIILCLIELSCTNPVFAQAQPRVLADEPQSGLDTAEGNQQGDPEVLGILIPIDESLQLAGSYAYIPQQLYDFLFNGDATEANAGSSGLLSAEYLLRISPTNATDRDLIQEFSAEFGIVLAGNEREFQLPISMNVLPLVRYEVNGRDESFGQTIRVSGTSPNTLVFSAMTPGRYQLKLYFDPTLTLLENGSAEFQVAIPRVPSANLRVVHDSNTRVEVDAIGAMQRTGNQLSVALGPVDSFRCSWFSREIDIISADAVSTSSHVWVDARADKLAAVAALEVVNPFALPETFRLVLDENWEAIGTTWGDASIVSVDVSPLSGRRVFSARWNDSLKRSAERGFVRVALAPRSDLVTTPNSGRPVPFVVLQESAQIRDRTVTWSATQDSTWQTAAEMTWLPIADVTVSRQQDLWGPFAFNADARSYRAPIGVSSTTLSRKVVQESKVVNEISQVHLGTGQARIVYSGQWEQPRSASQPLLFLIPKNSRVNTLLIDGLPWNFQLVERNDDSLLIAYSPSGEAQVRSAELEITHPLNVGEFQTLRRIVAADTTARSSIVRVLREAELQCQLQSPGPESIQFEVVSARPTELLQNLEAMVGQAELGERFRESADLPVLFRLSTRQAKLEAEAIVYVERYESQWRAELKLQLKSSQLPDFVYFEVPSSLRDSIELRQLPLRFIPTGNPARTVLAVMLPSIPAEDIEISLRYPIRTTAAGKQLTIPHVQPLLDQNCRLTLALPSFLDEAPVDWRAANDRLAADETPASADNAQFTYFSLGPNSTQVTWESQSLERQLPALLFSKLTLREIGDQSVAATIDYWINPYGNTELGLNTELDVQIVGAMLGAEAARVARRSPTSVSVLLQPNFAPVLVRVLVRWPRDLDDSISLKLPRPIADPGSVPFVSQSLSAPPTTPDSQSTIVEGTSQNPTWAIEVASPDWKLAVQKPAGLLPASRIANLWMEVVTDSLDSLQGQPVEEVAAWLRNWHPSLLGIDQDTPITLDAQDNEAQTVAQIWAQLCDENELPAVSPPTAWPQMRMFAGDTAALFTTAAITDQIELRKEATPSSLWLRAVAAAALALLVLVITLFGARITNSLGPLISQQPWILWLILTAVCWLLLPVAWPALILLLVTAYLAFMQLADRRRNLKFR